MFLCMFTLFYKKIRLGLSTENSLSFCDFGGSKFLKSFVTFFLIYRATQGKKTRFDS